MQMTVVLVLLLSTFAVAVQCRRSGGGLLKADSMFKDYECDLNDAGVVDSVTFYLFTSENKGNDEGQVIQVDDGSSLKASHYDCKRRTVVTVHGWFGGFQPTKWNVRAKDALLSKEDVNVIVVDWGALAQVEYNTAARRTLCVGISIASLVKYLERKAGTLPKTVHLIGHSLGGQTVGIAGERLKPRVGRITGIDVAESNFENCWDGHNQLDHTDAEFVDEIKGIISNNAYRRGHATFYPNGGNDDHNGVAEYLIQSIYGGTCSYPAYKCDSWFKFVSKDPGCTSISNHMGYYAVKPEEPTAYYLLVADAAKPCPE